MPSRPLPSFLEKRYPFILFAFFYFVLISLTYRDYGETWDESGVYTRGIVLGRYLMDGQWMGMLHKAAPDDGMVLYDHWYAWLQFFLNPAADLDYYHWLNMAFGIFLFGAAYEVLLTRVRKPWMALLGPLFIFLTPRLSGDLPANPKDGPFAVLYFVSLAAVFLLSLKPKWNPLLKILVLGILFGLTQSERLVGFTLYGVWILFEFYLWRQTTRGLSLRILLPWVQQTFLSLILIFLTANFILVATWPYLGSDYFHRLSELLTVSRNYHWTNQVLFLGKEIPSADLPRTYLPVWFLVSTPLFVLFWFFASFQTLAGKKKNPLGILLATAFGINLFLYFSLNPVVYDGIRHFLFLLPLASVMAAGAFIEFSGHARTRLPKRPLWVLTGLGALFVVAQMVRLHPYEYVYFNELTGGLKGAAGRFETDYWGASFKEGVEWLKRNESQDPPKRVAVTGSGNAYQIDYYFSDSMRWTDDLGKADYYLATTRDGKDKLVDSSKIIHVVEREGVPLNYVFKLR